MAVQKKYLSGSGMKGKNTPLVRAGGVRQLALSIRRVNDKELSAKMREASKKAAEEIVPSSRSESQWETLEPKKSIKATATGSQGQSMQETNASPPGRASRQGRPQGRYVPLLGSNQGSALTKSDPASPGSSKSTSRL